MTQYICLSDTPWQAVPTRTQQLMTRMRDAQVIFIEPPAANYLARRTRRVMRPGLNVYTMPPIIHVDEHHPYLFRRNIQRLVHFVEKIMERHRFENPIIWCTSPLQVHLLEHLSYSGIVYDCRKKWTQYPDYWEDELTVLADIVFAASPGLVRHIEEFHDNVTLLENGANYPMFSREDLPKPRLLRGMTTPILGYCGTIWRDLDLGPVLSAAHAHPEWEIVLVGEMMDNPWIAELEQYDNVRFLGACNHIECPDYVTHFDVCLNLLRRGEMGSDMMPSRFYEYLSTGRPIVSMLYPDQVEPYPDVVYNAHNAQEFVQLCEHALAEVGDWARLRRRDYGATTAWSERAGEATKILKTIGFY